MISTKEFNQIFRQEFGNLSANIIFQNDDGDYELFDHYKIIVEKVGYRVYSAATDVGIFMSTKSAVSYCIADKYKHYNLAREIYNLDSKLSALTSDILTRATLADRSKNPVFRETIESKLETKIIHKKQVENELSKCINFAKYYQQQGFNNETIRTGRNQAIKASR